MKTLKDFYKEDPKAYADIVEQANRENKDIQVVDDKLVLVEREPVILDYKHQRAILYPKIKDQLDMIWHAIDEGSLDKDSDFYKELKKVKDNYPKDAKNG